MVLSQRHRGLRLNERLKRQRTKPRLCSRLEQCLARPPQGAERQLLEEKTHSWLDAFDRTIDDITNSCKHKLIDRLPASLTC
jgi:hypothetical protein